MYDRHDKDTARLDPVDHAVAVGESLADRRIIKFGNKAASFIVEAVAWPLI